MKRRSVWALALAGAALVLLLVRSRGEGRLEGPAARPLAEGPVERPISASAAVAPDDAALSQLLGDRAGPKEIRLLPRVYRGDLHVTRPVTLVGEKGATDRKSVV